MLYFRQEFLNDPNNPYTVDQYKCLGSQQGRQPKPRTLNPKHLSSKAQTSFKSASGPCVRIWWKGRGLAHLSNNGSYT